MSRASPVTDNGVLLGHYVRCPACDAAGVQEIHVFDADRWQFNGDVERPTFSPSMLAQGNHAGKPWRCHSFVRDGCIEYLSDCTHSMAGQTVELPVIERTP